ncbi:hypothetical protein JOC74_002764 [Bacillus capparidis]|uniref:Uncharacterized protein n=1 Tax=Bacillus capparidis TaxID=1840411 RepID=A0ABS4CY26_9BACI|nr:hypothetical protein [Bacillus capparidis]
MGSFLPGEEWTIKILLGRRNGWMLPGAGGKDKIRSDRAAQGERWVLLQILSFSGNAVSPRAPRDN